MDLAPRAATARARQPRTGVTAALAAVSGFAWLAIAATSAWLVFGTPLLARVTLLDTRGASGGFVAAVAWALAMTAPACFAILGILRLGAAVQRVRNAQAAVPPVTRRAASLPPGCCVVPRIRLPDGRRVPDVVVGPHGVALFESLPPRGAARRTGERWEVRFDDRRWRPIENPLEKAARDADSLRRHLEVQERDFVVRVVAAVIRGDHDVARTVGCAVVALEDVPGWLAALPAQRGLTPDRVAHIRGVLEELA
jgi:hypothetical protein